MEIQSTAMESHLTATEAIRSFSELLERVRVRGETFVIESGGVPVCRMTPVVANGHPSGEALARRIEGLPRPDPHFADDLETIVRQQPHLPDSPWEP